MPNVSSQELMSALQKSGVPFGDSAQMRQANPFVKDAVSQQLYGQDTQIPALQGKYKSQIDQIAQMDNKLKGIYGDPSSSMYIANPAARESAVTGHHTTDYQAASGIATQARTRASQLDQETNDALSLYSKLTTAQKASEKGSGGRRSGGGGAGNPTYNQDGSINPTDGVDTSNMTKAQYNAYLTQTGKKLTDPAGIYDRDARNAFLNMPTAFQHYFISNVKDVGYPKNGYSADEIRAAQATWERAYGNKGNVTFDPNAVPTSGVQVMQMGAKGKKTAATGAGVGAAVQKALGK